MKYLMKLIIKIFLLILTISFSCCVSKKDSILSEVIQAELIIFKHEANYYAFNSYDKNKTIILIFHEYKNYFRLEFTCRKPFTTDNLYAVVENKDEKILIYSELDISKFVYSNPKIISKITNLEIDKYSEHDYYRKFLYFNGLITSYLPFRK